MSWYWNIGGVDVQVDLQWAHNVWFHKFLWFRIYPLLSNGGRSSTWLGCRFRRKICQEWISNCYNASILHLWLGWSASPIQHISHRHPLLKYISQTITRLSYLQTVKDSNMKGWWLKLNFNKSGVKRLHTLGHLDKYMAQHGRIVKQSYCETV